MDVVAIGVDTHKASLAACAVDELGRPISAAQLPQQPQGPQGVSALAECASRTAACGS